MDEAVPRDLVWRCRRGMRELDVLLGRWLNQCWSSASMAERDNFAALLRCEDDQLWDWLLGRSKPEEPGLLQIVDAIRRLESIRA